MHLLSGITWARGARHNVTRAHWFFFFFLSQFSAVEKKNSYTTGTHFRRATVSLWLCTRWRTGDYLILIRNPLRVSHFNNAYARAIKLVPLWNHVWNDTVSSRVIDLAHNARTILSVASSCSTRCSLNALFRFVFIFIFSDTADCLKVRTCTLK